MSIQLSEDARRLLWDLNHGALVAVDGAPAFELLKAKMAEIVQTRLVITEAGRAHLVWFYLACKLRERTSHDLSDLHF